MLIKDITKAVIYDRGIKEFNGVKKHMALVAMIIATDKPLVTEDNPEIIAMGEGMFHDEFDALKKYQCPYPMGQIGNAILNVSYMNPDDLDPIE